MFYISHADAVSLEYLVRRAYKHCDRFGVVGIADADFLESSPLSAAVAILAPLSLQYSDDELEDVSAFWDKYQYEFSHISEANVQEVFTPGFVQNFIKDLTTLTDKYY